MKKTKAKRIALLKKFGDLSRARTIYLLKDLVKSRGVESVYRAWNFNNDIVGEFRVTDIKGHLPIITIKYYDQIITRFPAAFRKEYFERNDVFDMYENYARSLIKAQVILQDREKKALNMLLTKKM